MGVGICNIHNGQLGKDSYTKYINNAYKSIRLKQTTQFKSEQRIHAIHRINKHIKRYSSSPHYLS